MTVEQSKTVLNKINELQKEITKFRRRIKLLETYSVITTSVIFSIIVQNILRW